jgi:small subunit ribosomal protein S16
MSARIRLKKMGAKKRPCYRIVVMDSHSPRDGRAVDELGYYHPVESEERQLRLDVEKTKEWLAKGAEITDTARQLLNRQARALAKV